MRVLSFSSASSPQAPVLTASNGRCMLPSVVVLHSEACFARQKRPREENSTPRNGPHGRTTNRYGTHLTLSSSGRAWTFLWHSRSPAAHHLRYGATFFPIQLGVRSMELTYHGSKFKQAKSPRAYVLRA